MSQPVKRLRIFSEEELQQQRIHRIYESLNMREDDPNMLPLPDQSPLVINGKVVSTGTSTRTVRKTLAALPVKT